MPSTPCPGYWRRYGSLWTRSLLGAATIVLLAPAAGSSAQAGPTRQAQSVVDSDETIDRTTVPPGDSESAVRDSAASSDDAEPPGGDAGRGDSGETPGAVRDESRGSTAPSTSAMDADLRPVSSTRLRGEAAPVSLRRFPIPAVEERQAKTEADPAPTKQAAERGGERERKSPERTPSGERVWPLKPEDFTFTQAFGCVAQIAGFYNAEPGCPGSAPVVHTGVDLAAPLGTRFYAAASGWVTEAGLDRPEGLANTRIVIQHDGSNRGFATEYLHWIAAYVEPGDYVEAGEPIGEIGSVGYSTGPHLHFAVIDFDDGSHLDPLTWLPENRRSGAYASLPVGTKPIRFKNVNVDLPDYADPSPPPVPVEEEVPEPERGVQQDQARRDEQERERKADARERDDRRPRAEREPGDGSSADGPEVQGSADATSAPKDRDRSSRATGDQVRSPKDRSKPVADDTEAPASPPATDSERRNEDDASGPDGDGRNRDERDGNAEAGDRNDDRTGGQDGNRKPVGEASSPPERRDRRDANAGENSDGADRGDGQDGEKRERGNDESSPKDGGDDRPADSQLDRDRRGEQVQNGSKTSATADRDDAEPEPVGGELPVTEGAEV